MTKGTKLWLVTLVCGALGYGMITQHEANTLAGPLGCVLLVIALIASKRAVALSQVEKVRQELDGEQHSLRDENQRLRQRLAELEEEQHHQP